MNSVTLLLPLLMEVSKELTKDLFDRLINFIKHKIFGKDKEREDYWGFSKDLYEHGIFSDKTIKDLKEDYNWSKEYDKNKDHDDFDLDI